MSKSYKEIAEAWAQGRINALTRYYENTGLKASGDFGKSLESSVNVTPNIYIKILGGAQIGMMVNGRKPNKNQDHKKLVGFALWASKSDGFIEKWLKDKSLPHNAFAVAYNIGKYGVKVPNKHNNGQILENTFTVQDIDELFDSLGESISQNITSNYLKEWQ